MYSSFPWKKPDILSKWLVKISRDHWYPTKNDRVCSDHFIESDYTHPGDPAVLRLDLKPGAIPTVFSEYPAHKQNVVKRRLSYTSTSAGHSYSNAVSNRAENAEGVSDIKKPRLLSSPCVNDHDYAFTPEKLQKEFKLTKEKLKETQKELKSIKQKLKRRESKISKLIDEVQSMLGKEQHDILKLNFDNDTLTLFENELENRNKDPTGYRYSEELWKFAVTVHFYSAQAYEYLRKYLHLPHPATIRKWSASLNCKPGYLSEVIDFLKNAKVNKPYMKDCVVMFDAMAIRKEILYDKAEAKYVGFADCGMVKGESEDTVASETLVFLVSRLSGSWKYPIAYFLDDKLAAQTQVQMTKEAIIILTDAGFNVHATVCDGSYTNQSTASLLGCSLIPGLFRNYFPHPSDPEKFVYFILDACHQIKNVRNCLASMEIIFHNSQPIKWHYIKKLDYIQQEDNLHLANKLKSKHIQFQNHKMNVKLAVQTLSSSVADAIDFLREDMQMDFFQGSEKTTEFIRIFDRLFDMLNSKSVACKGFKFPMTRSNFEERRTFLENTVTYIEKLTDVKGKKLTSGKRKTAWIGFICTIKSTIAIVQHLLMRDNMPFKYVLTYKMSQDHLEMLFSRIRRRGGWNNNPNCLQLKWALRAILMKNGITPSNQANCIDIAIEEPNNTLFQRVPTKAHTESQEKMAEFSRLLRNPTEWNDQVLHYLSGYIARGIVKVSVSNQPSDSHTDPSCIYLFFSILKIYIFYP